MRIAIDARMLKPSSMHGIARYVWHLVENLTQLDNEHEFFILVNKNSFLKPELLNSNFKLIEIKSSWISITEHIEIPLVLKKLQINLFHAPSYIAPIFTHSKMIMTIHDLNHLVLPQFYTTLHKVYYDTIVKTCIKKSVYILTVSEFSKKEIHQRLGVSLDKIIVTYNGISNNYYPRTDKEFLSYVQEIYQLPSKFILCISNNKPHKNLSQLVKAWGYSNLTIPLVLACNVDTDLIKIADSYGKKHLLYFTSFIEEEHLPYVYSLAHLFVYPSTYEGFGLPPLEALACGIPIVISNCSSLPEVAQGNSIFMNPYDYKDIANALVIGVQNEELRSKIKKSGPSHAKKFSWHTMAKQTLKVYEAALNSNRSIDAREKIGVIQ